MSTIHYNKLMWPTGVHVQNQTKKNSNVLLICGSCTAHLPGARIKYHAPIAPTPDKLSSQGLVDLSIAAAIRYGGPREVMTNHTRVHIK